MGVIANPWELRRSAAEMMHAHTALTGQLRQLDTEVGTLASGAESWVGDGAESFGNAWRELQQAQIDMYNLLPHISGILTTFAGQIESAAEGVTGITASLGLPFVVGGAYHFDALHVSFAAVKAVYKDAAGMILARLNEAIAAANSADNAAANALMLVADSVRATAKTVSDGLPYLSFLLTQGNAFYTKGSAVAAMAYGFRLEERDGYMIAKGRRFFDNGAWGEYVMSGRLAGTRYLVDNEKVAKYMPANIFKSGMNEAVNVVDNENWLKAGKGGGVAGLALSVVGDAVDYSPWGSESKEGYMSTGFASAMVKDVGQAAVETGISVGAEILTDIIASTFAGSVVPGVGTAVGLAFGLGLALYDTFWPKDKQVWTTAQGWIKGGLDNVVRGTKGAARGISNAVQGAENAVHNAEKGLLSGISSVLHF